MTRHARAKNGHPPKVCLRCGRAFEWRKKWERDWEQVRYCSEKCRRAPARPDSGVPAPPGILPNLPDV